jgi:hypothetical protein
LLLSAVERLDTYLRTMLYCDAQASQAQVNVQPSNARFRTFLRFDLHMLRMPEMLNWLS